VTQIGAVLLAAGASRRYGDQNKLLADFDGRPMVRAVADAIVEVKRFGTLIVVTGFESSAIERALQGLPVRYAHNALWENGMGSSIATGISALSEDVAAAAIIPGDMPYLTAALLDRLALTFGESRGGVVVYPATPEGEQRNPVIWPRSAFGRLRKLKGREGGKCLLRETAEICIAVPVADDRELRDLDEPFMRPRSAKTR